MNTKEAAAEKVHAFMHNLCELLDDGAQSDVVWNYCIENAADAKNALAVTLNHYQKRSGANRLTERGAS